MFKIYSIAFLLFSALVFSQNPVTMTGKVMHQGNPVKNVDVVNITTKKSAVTNDNGDFSIEVKEDNRLIFISKDFLDKNIIVSKYDLAKKSITIQLEAKPIELDDVEVRAKESVKNLVTYEELAKIRIEKENSPLRNAAVYDGKLINAVDFIQIGKMIGKLFKKKNKKNKSKAENFNFKDYATNNFSKDFFTTTLELKPDETSLFLDFCQADPKSKEVALSEDEFTILDFLINKKTEFRKSITTSNE